MRRVIRSAVNDAPPRRAWGRTGLFLAETFILLSCVRTGEVGWGASRIKIALPPLVIRLWVNVGAEQLSNITEVSYVDFRSTCRIL